MTPSPLIDGSTRRALKPVMSTSGACRDAKLGHAAEEREAAICSPSAKEKYGCRSRRTLCFSMFGRAV